MGGAGKCKIVFVSGIDTDAGKSYATGWLARELMKQGERVMTMKFVQTGNCGMSEDIAVHREIMGTGLMPEDREGLTAPEIFTYPASAALAARLDGRPVDLHKIENAMLTLAGGADTLLVEGAGGLMVPLDYEGSMAIDFPLVHNLPVALVTSGKLGSINHTVLALEALRTRGMALECLLYNTFFDKDPTISADTFAYLSGYVEKWFPGTPVIKVPSLT